MLHVHRSASGDALVAALADVLRVPSSDPFAADTVAVPAKGVERWISQRLSHHLGAQDGDGVCARVDFPSPAVVLDEALAAVSSEHATATEAWAPEAATWPLVDVLDALPRAPVFAPLHHYLRGGPSRRYALAAKVARLFDAYGRDRPELVPYWAGVPADLAWQVGVWHRLRERLGPSPAELHEQALARLRRAAPGDRLCLYGVSRLTRTRLDVLAALATSREVHLFVHHPGQALWDRVGGQPASRRADDAAGQRVVHPLLGSLSRDVRELQQRLHAAAPDLLTHVHDGPVRDDDLLHRLQRDLRTDTLPDEKAPVAASDSSVQVHACHGAARQVEVLREVLLGLLKADRTLEPRDVLVMCPDVERYAPLVKAVFDTDSHPGGKLRVSIADRSPVQTNPLLGLATRLLELAGSRLTGAQLLDLAGLSAVREQLGLSDDDVEQLRAWTVAARVHWGLDGEYRDPWGLRGLPDGTWRVGLDRLFAGAVFGGTAAPYAGLLPVGGIDSTDFDLLGRFAELVDRLGAAMGALTGTKPVAQWLEALGTAVLELGGVPRDGAWQTAQLGRELAAIADTAGTSDAPLTLTDLRVLLEDRLAGRPTRTSFRTGALTVCTMTPMRSVPHRVVCLLGLDDTAFPRHGFPDGDDLLARDPRLGERDPRSEDRQLFLDAVLATTETLVITYTGADVRSGAHLPPAVPVGELLDALDLTAEKAREHVVRRHPLQPFDPQNFLESKPFSFDQSAYDGALALRNATEEALPFLAAPLPELEPAALGLRQLKDFWEHPAKAFLRQRLEVTATTRDEQPRDGLPLVLGNLEEWGVGDRVLRARMAGMPSAEAGAAEQARGQLPPGALGGEILEKVQTRVSALARAAAPWWGKQDSVEVDLRLPSGWVLSGTVPLRKGVVLQVGYSQLGCKQRLRAWVELLAVAATREGSWRAVVVARRKEDAVVEVLGPIERARAVVLLDELVILRAIGLRTPLTLPPKAAGAYAGQRKQGAPTTDARDAAAKAWESGFRFDGDDRDRENVLCWGPEQPFSALWSWTSPVPLPPLAGGEPTDFARLACAVWYPLLDATGA